MAFLPGLDVASVSSAASYINRPAEEYVNDSTVETQWVMQAIEFADIHFNLISSADPKLLKLTKQDDDRIYSHFKAKFPDFDLKDVSEESLKSDTAKEKWRNFCEALKDVEDYSFGTLLRLNCLKEYTEENTILVTRIQFLAVEIARNRQGINDPIYKINSTISKDKIEETKENS